MAYLYVNQKGIGHTKHSYSAGLLFKRCPYAYYLSKVEGWRLVDNKAALHFGRAVEETIEYHHDNGNDAVDFFANKWITVKDEPLKYGKTERDWESLFKSGTEMIRLYQILRPEDIPIGEKSVFQREYGKVVFGNDPNYGGIEFHGKLDIVTYALEKPRIWDIKVVAQELPKYDGISARDLQLTAYSWLTGMEDVGFVWFKKSGRKVEKGTRATLLKPVTFSNRNWTITPGNEIFVVSADEEIHIVPTEVDVQKMNDAQGYKNGKLEQTNAAKERREQWIRENSVVVSEDDFTQQKLRFDRGTVSQASRVNAGRIVGNQIQSIVNAFKSGEWENTFGIRYPYNDVEDPFYKAFVLEDLQYRNENFTKTDDGFEEEEIEDVA